MKDFKEMTEDDDLNLPRAAINKMIKETLPQVLVCITIGIESSQNMYDCYIFILPIWKFVVKKSTKCIYKQCILLKQD